MIVRPPTKRMTAHLALALLALGAGLALAPSLAAARGGSGYPAGAARPVIVARPSDFARAPARHRSLAVRGRSSARRAPRARRAPHKPALRGNAARALVAFEAMQKYYYLQGSGLYSGEPFSYLWPFSQAFAVTISMAYVPHLPISLSHELSARLVGLGSYLDTNNSGAPEGIYTSTLAGFDGTVAPPAGPGGTKYYDDNDWIGIELLRAYKLTHNPSVLGSAEAVTAFEMAGWDTSPEHACPGGIPFSNAAENTDRNTVTTAPAAELAAELYRITGNAQYLQFAQKAYEWVRRCLLTPSGLYADHISPAGVVEPMLWSYNQGTMIGAGTLLYQATGNSAYLYDARQTARAGLAYFTPERLGSEIPFFPAVYFRNLLYLDSVTHDPPGKRLAQVYVDYAWQHLRLRNNLFVAGSPPSAQLLVQAAIAQIYALLSSPASTYF
jgi:Glycosyl hydrolase family 76